jgi:hypothetical protein
MNNPDQDRLIRAVEDARRILGEYIEGPREPDVLTIGLRRLVRSARH